MPKELLTMQNNYEWETAEGQTLQLDNAIKSNARGLKIEGQTYQNLIDFTTQESTQGITFDQENSVITFIGTLDRIILGLKNFKPNTKYTLITNVLNIPSDPNSPIRINDDGTNYNYNILNCLCTSLGINKVTFTTPSDISNLKLVLYNNDRNVDYKFTFPIIIEGDFTNTDLPTKIKGIESVAERESKNLLENVKWHDGWVNVGTGALESTPSANPNAIYTDLIPIDINNRYYFNLASNTNNNVYRIRPYDANKNYVMPNDNAGNPNLGNNFNIFHANRSLLATVKYIRILLLDSSTYPLPSEPILVQNLYTEGDVNVKGKTAYYNVSKTINVNKNTNYNVSANIESISKGDNDFTPVLQVKDNNGALVSIDNGQNKTFNSGDNTQLYLKLIVNNSNVSATDCEANFKNIGVYEANLYPIKLTNRAKNLLNISTFKPISYNTIQTSKDGNVITVKDLKTADVEAYTDAKAGNIKVYLEEGKTYSASFKSDGKFGVRSGEDTVEIFFMLDGTTKHYFNVAGQRTVTIPKGYGGYYYLRLDVNSGDKTHKFWDIQVEEGSVVTDYEPYLNTTTEIPLPQPLRSLPNGVCDSIENGKLIQRVGKIVVDGTNNITLVTIRDNTLRLFLTDSTIKNVNEADLPFLCDSLPKTTSCWTYDVEGIYQAKQNNRFVISISRDKVGGATIEAVKAYFTANPITLYYELATPIEQPISVPRIPIGKGNNTITTTNNIKPKLTFKYKQSTKKIEYLYNSGNEYLNITGGWNTQLTASYGAATTIVKNANNIYFYTGVWNMLLTNSKIDVTNYDVVYMKYSKKYNKYRYHPARCAIKLGNKNTSWDDFANDEATATLTVRDETENDVTNGILTIDVSNVTGSYYVGIGGQSNNITVHEIGLKKVRRDTTTLYSNGNENKVLTGGYLTSSNNSATCNIEKQADNLYVNCTGKQSFDSICYARTNKTIKPCKIKVSVKNNSISAEGIAFCVFLSEKEAINSVSDFNSVVNKRYIGANNTTQGQYVDLEIDLTDNSKGYFYILCMVAGSTSYTCKANINKIEIME